MVMTVAVMMAVAMMMAMTVVPAAMMHLLRGRNIVRRGAEAAAERQRRRRGKPRCCEHERYAGQSHQDELAHAFSLSLVDSPTHEKARSALNPA